MDRGLGRDILAESRPPGKFGEAKVKSKRRGEGPMLSTLSTTISNLISLFLQSLRFSALFPALCFVIFNQWILLPLLEPPINEDTLKMARQPTWTLLFTIWIGYTINVLNVPIIRFFEGYPYRETSWGRRLRNDQRKVKRELSARKRYYATLLKAGQVKLPSNFPREEFEQSSFFKWVMYEYSLAQSKLDHFPEDDTSLLPTALGNTIAAFENYPSNRYGIRAIHMWPRLLPILSDKEYAIFVEREKATLDFMLNFSVLSALFGLECIVARLFGVGQEWSLVPLLAFVVSGLFYAGAKGPASNWGETVKVAFDLYRYELAERLALRRVWSKAEEKTRWETFSDFILGDDEEFGDFEYPLPRKSGIR